MHPVDLIRRKRDGGELSSEELTFLAQGAARGTIAPEQLAAWLMASWLRGMSPRELAALTLAMRDSGRVFDPSRLGRPAVDKHSTGGVGDKTSLLVAPIAAACGLTVPMISGRALGHTGGTLDKLETIPGYRTALTPEEFLGVLEACGCSIVGQSADMAPADRVLYDLRDRTATVESPSLICASIMSKKLAAGLDALVLDVKTGSGAFLKQPREAEELARLMVGTGEAAGTRTVALLTDMSQPLGRMAGNWLEVWESSELLSARRHPLNEDLFVLSIELSAWMIQLGGRARDLDEARLAAAQAIASGEARKHFLRMVAAQGGDPGVLADCRGRHRPAARRDLAAASSGYVTAMDTEAVGWAVQRLGAGRSSAGQAVDAHAGLEFHAKVGSRVAEGAAICTLYAASPAQLEEPEALLRKAILLGDHPPAPRPLIQRVISAETIAG